jgi:hypothetical protein
METWQSKSAFVIRLRENTDMQPDRLEGTVEHVASYKATRFRSVEELLAFMALVIAERTQRDSS